MASSVRLPRFLLLLALLAVTGPSLTAQDLLTRERGIREKDPVLSVDGRELYFTRPDHPRNQGTDGTADIWVRRRNPDGSWSRPLNPGSPVNSFRDDRPLGTSVDGNTLAVLRSGRGQFIMEQLVRSGRTWRATERWVLPEDVGNADNLTFNTNSQRLIYARESAATASLDLFQRVALPGGKWGPPLPLPALSSADDERHPIVASDGRTLYFRRAGGQWMRQLDRGLSPEAVDLPAKYLQLALAPGVTIATTDDLGDDEQLAAVSVPESVVLPDGQTVYASVGSFPAAGEATVVVPLSSGTSLAVRPDVLKRYAIVLREGEQAFPESHMPLLSKRLPSGSLATTPPATPGNRAGYLQQTLTEKQRELEQREQLQQELYTKIIDDGGTADAYVHLRPQADRGSAVAAADTVPPSATESSRERYAREMAELERMKEKFRRQQDEKLRERDRRGSLDDAWYNEPDTLAATEAGILPPDPRDTTVLRSSVRSGLYPAPQPDLSERRSWEHRVQGEVTPPAGSTEADAQYARKLEEVEALRSQLRRARESQRDLTGKSPVTGAGNTLEITFIDNTAYPNSGGYTALDQLAEYVQGAARVVEVRVHTSPELSPRAAQLLSEERATTIRTYLREAGAAAENFRVVGYGNHEAGTGERVEVIRE